MSEQDTGLDKSKEHGDAADNQGPTTMMTGMTQADLQLLKPDKKKKKKKKLTSEEKALAKLEKEADILKKSGLPFQEFVDKVDRWMMRNHKKAIALFKKTDEDGMGTVSYSAFKTGMFDLTAPCNSVELHLLVQLLDTDKTNEIKYLQFSSGLASVREIEESYQLQDIRPTLPITKRELNHCCCCKMGLWDGESYKEEYPRFIEVEFRLLTFEGQSHPCHFQKVVHSHVSVAHLQQMIQENTQILSSKIIIFRDKLREPSSVLSFDMTLEDYGFEGGTLHNPASLRLYYDYSVEFKDCPLLLCDHYFGKKL